MSYRERKSERAIERERWCWWESKQIRSETAERMTRCLYTRLILIGLASTSSYKDLCHASQGKVGPLTLFCQLLSPLSPADTTAYTDQPTNHNRQPGRHHSLHWPASQYISLLMRRTGANQRHGVHLLTLRSNIYLEILYGSFQPYFCFLLTLIKVLIQRDCSCPLFQVNTSQLLCMYLRCSINALILNHI